MQEQKQNTNLLHKPTEAVLDNIQRGIALKSKFQRNSIASDNTLDIIKASKEAINSGFTLDVVKSMYRTLSKLECTNLHNTLHDGGPSEDAIRFYAAGGSAGLAWSRLVLKDAGVITKYNKVITEADTKKQDDSKAGAMPVVKAVEPALMQALYVVLEPDAIDAHLDTYDATEVRKACENFNKAHVKANLFHMIETTSFSIIESYISPVDMVFGEKIIKSGTWLVKLQFNNTDIYQDVLDNKFSGVSIGAMATVETIE